MCFTFRQDGVVMHNILNKEIPRLHKCPKMAEILFDLKDPNNRPSTKAKVGDLEEIGR